MTVRVNYDDIVQLSVIGEIISPRGQSSPYRVTFDGRPVVLPGTGGIVYNVRIGDRAIGWASDHMEPCVTIRNKDEAANHALNVLACIGNEARVVSGEAKGSKGTVTGKHGGAEHVMVDFEPDVLERLTIGDKVQVRAYGRGLQLLDLPEVKLLNIGVQLLKALPLDIQDGSLGVPVAGVVPAELMGSGVGSASERGDVDIQTADGTVLAQHGLENLRLGDIVAITDQDHSFGRGYRKGAVSIAVIAHTDSFVAGHGPGITTLMTSASGKIQPRIAPEEANISTLLNLR